MGDLFHQTNANQSATNQQQGISAGQTGGSVITIGHGAASQGGTLTVQTLDPAALKVAGDAIHDAAAVANNASQGALQAYQQALTIAGQQAQSATQLASSGAGSGANVAGGAALAGFNPSQLIWIAGAAVILLLVMGMRK